MSLKFSVADMTIHRIVEMEIPLRPILQMLPGLTPEVLAENRSWLQPDALDSQDRARLCFQSYIVETPHHTILVDSCVGNNKRRDWPEWNMKTDDTYLRGLNAAGFSVEDIDYVMCTHLHVDHVGWNTQLVDGRWVPTFPNARYVFDAEEHAYWEADNVRKEIYLDSVLPIVEAGRADLVSHDYQLGDHVRILPTPGHTKGHVSFRLGKTADDAVMPGDVMHSPLQARYPELSNGVDYDMAQSAASRKAFLERYCDTRTLCCTAHFPSPSVGRIKRWGDGFKCETVTEG